MGKVVERGARERPIEGPIEGSRGRGVLVNSRRGLKDEGRQKSAAEVIMKGMTEVLSREAIEGAQWEKLRRDGFGKDGWKRR